MESSHGQHGAAMQAYLDSLAGFGKTQRAFATTTP
jgi:hypothetical protein